MALKIKTREEALQYYEIWLDVKKIWKQRLK